jgi:hypothetical protein
MMLPELSGPRSSWMSTEVSLATSLYATWIVLTSQPTIPAACRRPSRLCVQTVSADRYAHGTCISHEVRARCNTGTCVSHAVPGTRLWAAGRAFGTHKEQYSGGPQQNPPMGRTSQTKSRDHRPHPSADSDHNPCPARPEPSKGPVCAHARASECSTQHSTHPPSAPHRMPRAGRPQAVRVPSPEPALRRAPPGPAPPSPRLGQAN